MLTTHLTLTQQNPFTSHQMKIPKIPNSKSSLHHPQTHLHQTQMTHTHKMKKEGSGHLKQYYISITKKIIITNNSQLPLEIQNTNTPPKKQISDTSNKYTLRKHPPQRKLNNPQRETLLQSTNKRPPPTHIYTPTLHPNQPLQDSTTPLIYNPYS